MAERTVHDHDDAEGLVPLDEAREAVVSQIQPLPPLELPLTDAYGCVAATDIAAAVDLPEFASSGMDGFAVRAMDVVDASPATPAELSVRGANVASGLISDVNGNCVGSSWFSSRSQRRDHSLYQDCWVAAPRQLLKPSVAWASTLPA